MSEYYNTSDLFLEPKTTQYGSHMVMSNVHKPKKTKYINIDTRFRDEYNYLQTANYNITLPERINDVKTMRLTNIEIPMTIFNISANAGNNHFKIINAGANTNAMLIIPDGNYDKFTMATTMNSQIQLLPSPFNKLSYATSENFSIFYTSDSTLSIEFDIDTAGQNDKYNIKSKLGWALGYRNLTYTITTANTMSECFVDLLGPRYLYLAIEEFNKGNQNSFITPLATSLINKNIIARIAMDERFAYGTILPANQYNGLLISDKRSYTGKIDLLKVNVQLLNETGTQVALNGMDFSFCLEIEHE